MNFRIDKFTIKAQEAVQRGEALAQEKGHPEIDALHLLTALLGESEGIVLPILQKIGVNRTQLDGMIRSEMERYPHVSGDTSPNLGRELAEVLQAAQREADTMKDEFVSTEHLLLALAKVDSKAKNVLQAQRRPRERGARGAEGPAGQHARDRPESGGQVPGLAAVRHRPGRAGATRQARSGDRPRPGNPPRDPGPVAAHEEQPRADRRAGRRQDGHRRRAGPADRAGRRAAEPQEQARRSRSTWARWSPARSFAANSRSG